MKKYINNKLYNTDTAKAVGYWEAGGNPDDFSFVSERLYRKSSGEFFLHGEGGPYSKYAAHGGGDNWGPGEKIIPLTYEEAQKWAEEKLDADEYEAIFGPAEDDGTKETVHLSLTKGTAEQLRRLCSAKGCSMAELVTDLIKGTEC